MAMLDTQNHGNAFLYETYAHRSGLSNYFRSVWHPGVRMEILEVDRGLAPGCQRIPSRTLEYQGAPMVTYGDLWWGGGGRQK